MYGVAHYLTKDGRDIFQTWMGALRDRQAQARIATRIGRLAAGPFGDCKALFDGGVWAYGSIMYPATESIMRARSGN